MESTKKRVMLVYAAACHLDKATEQALEQVKSSGSSLAILFVVDPKAADAVAATLSNSAFIGDKPADDLKETLMKDYRLRAETQVEELADLAREQGIDAMTYVREGEIEKESIGLVKELGVDLLIIPRCKRTPLTELVMGSACNRLKINAPCEVLMVDEN